jgi:hypothetical protein
MSKKKFQNEDNPFQQSKPSASEVDKLIYGEVDIPESGRIVAKPLPIMSISPDKTQPRKIVPREIHAGRNINPADMPNILGAWIDAIYEMGIDEIPIEDILLGKHRGSDKDNSLTQNKHPLVEPFVSLLMMAADIRDIGLKQAVEVVETRKDEYRLVLGERRWTAYHLLRMFLGDKYANIPAQVSRASAWDIAKAQAAENFHQRQLTAIGIARQFAKLLILARQDSQDPSYDDWDDLVVDGGCDRPYYAQVADGNIHRIPKGMMEEFERTLNISDVQMRKYRGLLRLTGDYDIDNRLWDLGDERGWAEGFLRDIGTLEVSVIRQIFSEADEPEEMFREAVSSLRAEKKSQIPFQIGTVSDGNTVTTGNGIQDPKPEGGNKFKYGDEVVTVDGPGRIIQTQGNTHLVRLDAGATKRYGDVTLQAQSKGESWFNRYVQNPTGGVAMVIADLGEFCEVEYADGGRASLHKMYLSEVDKSEWQAAVQRHREMQPPPSLMNFVGKVVHTFQGVGKVTRNHDTQYVEVQFPDGDTLTIPKKDLSITDPRHWDEAIAALVASIDDEDEQKEIKQGDTVRVDYNGRQFSGIVRYIEGLGRDEKPYGVHNDETHSTHYYPRSALTLLESTPSAGKEPSLKDVSYTVTSKIRELNSKAFDGWNLDIGWQDFHREIMAKYGLNHHIVLT